MEILHDILGSIAEDAPIQEVRRGLHWNAVISRYCGLSSTLSQDACCCNTEEEDLPSLIKPLSYVLPLTYGADILQGAFNARNIVSFALDFAVLGVFCIFLFAWSLRNIKRRWIL